MPRMRTLPILSPSLVVMIGAAGSGKSSFCRRNFRPDQIVSSDACRERVSGDPADQEATSAAFGLAHRLTEERLRRGRLTVFDATSVGRRARRPLLEMARRHNLPAVACVLQMPVRVCAQHDRGRPERPVGRAVILRQARELTRSLPGLRHEGFAAVHHLRSPRSAASTRVSLVPLPCNRTRDRGPFDVIGDVHGCARELVLLLRRLGYQRASPRAAFRHPAGRRAVFLGDLVDRGPGIVDTVRIVMRMVAAGVACCVSGNHDESLLRCLEGGAVTRSPGLLRSLRQIRALSKRRRARFVDDLRAFVGSLPAHLVFDRGRLAVAHAGLRADHLGRDSEAIRRFALLGETTGDVDRYGLPVRVKWAAAYRGKTLIVYGHTPVPAPEWLGNTVNIDTGCVYGGKLTALRYPEREVVSVAAARPYYRPRRSLPTRIGLRAETRALPSTL